MVIDNGVRYSCECRYSRSHDSFPDAVAKDTLSLGWWLDEGTRSDHPRPESASSSLGLLGLPLRGQVGRNSHRVEGLISFAAGVFGAMSCHCRDPPAMCSAKTKSRK